MATLSPRSLLAVHPLSPWLLEEMQLADWPPGSAGPRGPPAHTFHVEGQLLMPRPGAGTPLATAILKPCRPHPLPVGHLLLPPWARGLPAPPHGPLGPRGARAPRRAPRSLPPSLESVSATCSLPCISQAGSHPDHLAAGAAPSCFLGVPLAPCLFSVLQSPPPTHGLPPCRLRLFNTHWDSFLPPSPLSLSFAEARVVSCLSISASLLICSLLRSHKGHRLWA